IDNFAFTFGAGNVNPNFGNSLATTTLGRKYWDFGTKTWLPFPPTGLPPGWDPNARTVILVPGLTSSLDNEFGNRGCNDGQYAVDKIQRAGFYDQVAGLDYDWRQHLDVSGQDLANFPSQTGLKNVDFYAHSLGAAVAISAASKITDSTILIPHIISVA